MMVKVLLILVVSTKKKIELPDHLRLVFLLRILSLFWKTALFLHLIAVAVDLIEFLFLLD